MRRVLLGLSMATAVIALAAPAAVADDGHAGRRGVHVHVQGGVHGIHQHDHHARRAAPDRGRVDAARHRQLRRAHRRLHRVVPRGHPVHELWHRASRQRHRTPQGATPNGRARGDGGPSTPDGLPRSRHVTPTPR